LAAPKRGQEKPLKSALVSVLLTEDDTFYGQLIRPIYRLSGSCRNGWQNDARQFGATSSTESGRPGSSRCHGGQPESQSGNANTRSAEPRLGTGISETPGEFCAIDQPVWLWIASNKRGRQNSVHFYFPLLRLVGANSKFHEIRATRRKRASVSARSSILCATPICRADALQGLRAGLMAVQRPSASCDPGGVGLTRLVD
jgi:hypothetical protein